MTRQASKDKVPVVIVTGLSGGGKSIALRAFEDIGFETVDNLPVNLLPRLLSDEAPASAGHVLHPIAIGIDCRTRAFNAETLVDELRGLVDFSAIHLEVLFFDCEDDVLERRFSETRRRHPLARTEPVREGILRERMMMIPVQRQADTVLDTSEMTPNDCRAWISEHYALDRSPQMTISIVSFSFARGLPREANIVFDVRFLRNPHYDPALRPLTGTDKEVADYVKNDPDFATFDAQTMAYLDFVIPRMKKEGRSYLTIAFGCTGGRHRSVFLAEHTGKALQKTGCNVTVAHRDARRPL